MFADLHFNTRVQLAVTTDTWESAQPTNESGSSMFVADDYSNNNYNDGNRNNSSCY